MRKYELLEMKFFGSYELDSQNEGCVVDGAIGWRVVNPTQFDMGGDMYSKYRLNEKIISFLNLSFLHQLGLTCFLMGVCFLASIGGTHQFVRNDMFLPKLDPLFYQSPIG